MKAPFDERARAPSGRASAWARFTEPHSSVTSSSQRRRLRMAAGLLIILIPIALSFLAYYSIPVDPGSFLEGDALILGTAIALIVAYLLVRGRRGGVGLWMAVLVPWGAIAIGWLHQPMGQVDGSMWHFMIVPVLLAGLLLTVHEAAALTVATIVVAATVPTSGISGIPQLPAEQAIDAAFFLVATSPLILLGSSLLVHQLEATNRRLRAADEFRVQLLSTIAHDIGSPMTPMKLQLYMLEKEGPPSDRIEVIKRNLAHIERLVSDVRDLSRLQTGHLDLKRKDMEIVLLTRQAIEMFTHTARDADVDLAGPVGGPVTVSVDPDRLNQVMYNLITNAIKFTARGGRVDVAVAANGDAVRVSVRDTGRGLTGKEIDQLFKPFSQIHTPGEVTERGTGLGLFISKGIIDAHGGRIGVHSDGRGKGSTFWFELPLG